MFCGILSRSHTSEFYLFEIAPVRYYFLQLFKNWLSWHCFKRLHCPLYWVTYIMAAILDGRCNQLCASS